MTEVKIKPKVFPRDQVEEALELVNRTIKLWERQAEYAGDQPDCPVCTNYSCDFEGYEDYDGDWRTGCPFVYEWPEGLTRDSGLTRDGKEGFVCVPGFKEWRDADYRDNLPRFPSPVEHKIQEGIKEEKRARAKVVLRSLKRLKRKYEKRLK